MILFLKKFTFQSGDIQILERMLARRNLESKFTFQSGDIQILIIVSSPFNYILIYIPIW